MIKVEGKYNNALCYCSELEKTAAGQIKAVCDQEVFADSRIRIMPDVHAGMGCAIGTAMTVLNRVVPGMVGVDIGCGMETIRINEIVEQIEPTAEILCRIKPLYNFKATE